MRRKLDMPQPPFTQAETDLAKVEAEMEPYKMQLRNLLNEGASLPDRLRDASVQSAAQGGTGPAAAHLAQLARRAEEIPRERARLMEILKRYEDLRQTIMKYIEIEQEPARLQADKEAIRRLHRPFDKPRPGNLGAFDRRCAEMGFEARPPTPAELKETRPDD